MIVVVSNVFMIGGGFVLFCRCVFGEYVGVEVMFNGLMVCMCVM